MGLLNTDAYKFSMMEAGWPLRRETFYYSHRKGGPCILPIDVKKFIKELLPNLDQRGYLDASNYGLSVGSATALEAHDQIVVNSIPQFSIFFPGEPVFSVTGPSALVSWLEPLVLQINFRIQVATLALLHPELIGKELSWATCREESEIVKETLDQFKKSHASEVQTSKYQEAVLYSAKVLVSLVEDPSRLFEVGLRSATCIEQHMAALEACQEAGISRTSHVHGARVLGMRPVGTMGHEHVMRYGSDEAAFRAIKDRRPYRSSFLLDTFDTFLSGIPAAFKVMAENPQAQDSIRYDSGNKTAQYLYAVAKARDMSLDPVHILEDGFDDEQTAHFENLRKQVEIEKGRQVYGYGGYLIAKNSFNHLHRDAVAAVYKLSQTGPQAVMKFGNDAGGGKKSIPGRPVVWRRRGMPDGMPFGIVAQEGEKLEGGGYFKLTDEENAGSMSIRDIDNIPAVIWSAETKALASDLEKKKKEMLFSY